MKSALLSLSDRLVCPPARCGRRLLACLLALAVSLTATAKPLPTPFSSDFQAENWSAEDGFPANSCSGIALGPDGYLWLGTFRGLVRFNGHTFKPWGPPEMPSLATTGILSIHRDRSDRVWFNTIDGSLIVRDGGLWHRWTAAQGWDAAGDSARSFADAGDITVIGRSSGRVLRLEQGKFQELPRPPGTGGALVALDREGTLYAFRRAFVGLFVDGAWQRLGDDPTLAAHTVGVTQARDGDVRVVCQREILRVRGGRIVGRTALSEPVTSFWQAGEDPSGAFWFSSLESGVFRIQLDGTVRHFRKADGLPHAAGTRVVQPGADGSVWIGSGIGGLTRLRPTRFRYLGEEEGMGEREVLTVTTQENGLPLFAPYGDGLKAFDGTGRIVPLRLGHRLPLFSRAMLRTRDGLLWFGGNSAGLFRVDATSAVPAATEFLHSPVRDSIHTLFEDSRGRLWVGGERNILRREDGVFHRLDFPATHHGRRPTLFAEGRDGTIFIAQHFNVYAYGPSGLQPEPVLQLPKETRISTLLVDSRDRLWIGTATHGLAVFHEGKLGRLGVNRGLPGAAVAALVQDDLGKLWFGAGRHVVRADPDELHAATRDATLEPRFVRFDAHDGIRSLDFTYGTQPNVIKDAQGRLWFAMIRGAAMVDPAQLTTDDREPPVVIESISYLPEGARAPVVTRLEAGTPPPILPAGSRQIQIDYSALALSSPHKHLFRIALDGEWQDVGSGTTATFFELPPGRHRLQVQAASGDGIWNRTGATLVFEIATPLWRTLWFRLVAGVALLGLTAAILWLLADRRTRVARDTLERERRLNEAQARLALILENTSDFVAFADASGALLYVNPAGLALVGVPGPLAPRSLPLPSLLPPWAETIFRETALPAALARGNWSGEAALLSREGNEIPVSIVLLAHRGDDGSLDYTSVIARDITAAKRHAATQDALHRLATALTGALDAPALGRIVAEACRVLFRHDAFLLGLLAEDDAATRIAYAEDTRDGSAAPHPVESPVLDFTSRLDLVRDGRPLLINRDSAAPEARSAVAQPWGEIHRRSRSIMYAPIRLEGRTIGILSLQSYTPDRYREADLAQLETVANHCSAAIARLRAEELLRKREEQSRQTQKLEAVGTLAGGIAHDFNNILTAIACNAELASFDLGPHHPTRDFIEKIQQSSTRARDLVRRILAFSRPQPAQRQAASAAAVVEEVAKLLRSTTPALIELSTHVAADLPPADIDATELHQVLLNLGTNAVHAIGNTSGSVDYRVSLREVTPAHPPAPQLPPGSYVHIEVTDTGSGIPADVLPRIFDPFFTTKQPGEGTGLGLSVAHGIVKARGGAITVTSAPGRGSTFSLDLPVSPVARPAPESPPRAAATPPPAGHRARLLIVDDEEMIVHVLRSLFTRAGYAVQSFSRPAEALAAFQQDAASFDLVITDLSMPEMSGITLTQQIRALRPNLPIVLISGYLRSADEQAARAAGVTEIVEKPIAAEQIMSLVARALPTPV